MQNIQSPRTDDAGIEKEIAAKSTAPRVTPADLEAAIASEHYFSAMDGVVGRADNPGIVAGTPVHSPLDLLTFCVLVLKNGFTVTGESAPVSADNFDIAIGEKIARQNAINKLWPLLGFALKQKLHEAA